jgi:hypothetical protein
MDKGAVLLAPGKIQHRLCNFAGFYCLVFIGNYKPENFVNDFCHILTGAFFSTCAEQ